MIRSIVVVLVLMVLSSCSKDKNTTPQLKPLLIEQLNQSYTKQNWFVPVKVAIEGVTVEQSFWKDSTDNHSIAELVSHINFWNEINLRAFNGEENLDFKVDNAITFKAYDYNEWQSLVKTLDSIQTEWLDAIENASDTQLDKWSSDIANMCSHNAYHTGQIVYIRKRNGWWKK